MIDTRPSQQNWTQPWRPLAEGRENACSSTTSQRILRATDRDDEERVLGFHAATADEPVDFIGPDPLSFEACVCSRARLPKAGGREQFFFLARFEKRTYFRL